VSKKLTKKNRLRKINQPGLQKNVINLMLKNIKAQ